MPWKMFHIFYFLACGIFMFRKNAISLTPDFDRFNFHIRQQHMMDSKLGTCGTTKEDYNGEIWSHTGMALKSLSTGGFSQDSHYDDSVDCVITINMSALGEDWRILVQFDTDVDLGAVGSEACDTLDIYDGIYNPDSPSKMKSVCGNVPQPDPLESTGTMLSFHFHGYKDGQSGRGFALSYSAFHHQWNPDGSCGPDELKCDDTRCIPIEFECDVANQCVDGTDETQDCILGFYMFFVGLPVGLSIIVIGLISLCAYCCCCRKQKPVPTRPGPGPPPPYPTAYA